MSQIIKSLASGPVPPAVPDQFTTDDGSIAIPVGNNLNVLSRDTTDNNINGIQTIADPPNGDDLYVELTNRITGTATTTDDVTPQTVYSFPLGLTPGSYLFNINVTAFNITDNLSSGYSSFRLVRTDGITATSIGATTSFVTEEGIMTNVVVTNGVSGNNVTLTVTGLAGKTIHWLALADYIFTG
jgi:hypothetical protein